jgi:S1-C subfamily serine protease
VTLRSHLTSLTLTSLLQKPLLSLSHGALALLLVGCATLPLTASQDWTATAAKVERALVALQDESGENNCTGFVIDANRDNILTAAHCLPPVEGGLVLVDRKLATTLWADQELDLAVIQAPTEKGALRPSSRALKTGLMALSAGYAYGLTAPLMRHAMLSHPAYALPDQAGTWLAFDSGVLIGGMSGGPFVDRDAGVIGINQLGNNQVGLGRSIAVILAHTAQFWAR